ncbi:uncharacterized protein LOC109710520 [Ananas comosus]|uniref:Uncharacterized protein LOC109710520 n=1 Tax=Ananas comosus TaxID=4615 RepID=A0A6P5EZ19_ANACO|nr:uncharacterized protein LOC109710520 [Ananas comosus]
MSSPSPPSSSSSSSSLPPPWEKPLTFLLTAAQPIHSLTSGVLSRLPFSPFAPPHRTTTNRKDPPPSAAAAAAARSSAMTMPLLLPFSSSSSYYSDHRNPNATSGVGAGSAVGSVSPGVRIEALNSSSKGARGPAFVGQVFSMLDPSGNGLMAVTTHFDIPFLSKRTPAWLKKMFALVTKGEQNGPVFRFFMDLSDAVSYVKRLNVPTGMVGACRLDVAYEHFKEKPHMFQFVPNEKQVKAANKLLKVISRKGGKRKIDGVPVFTAQNLNIAIATNDGIKWYTPYFFDKNLLDNILEASIDQHFRTMIQNRHMQRRRDVIDDSLTAEIVEESGDSLFEPPEVQEVLDEMGHTGIPLNVLSKAAEIQFLDVVDKVLLGNKWLRKATGIQPKFPYLVDSFEERTAASFSKLEALTSIASNLDGTSFSEQSLQFGASGASDTKIKDNARRDNDQLARYNNFPFPFSNWLPNLWPRHGKFRNQETQCKSSTRVNKHAINGIPLNPLLPKITMVGMAMGEGGQVNKASLKKTMEDLTKELEQSGHSSTKLNEDKDPLFVANVGDYSSITRISSS